MDMITNRISTSIDKGHVSTRQTRLGRRAWVETFHLQLFNSKPVEEGEHPSHLNHPSPVIYQPYYHYVAVAQYIHTKHIDPYACRRDTGCTNPFLSHVGKNKTPSASTAKGGHRHAPHTRILFFSHVTSRFHASSCPPVWIEISCIHGAITSLPSSYSSGGDSFPPPLFPKP